MELVMIVASALRTAYGVTTVVEARNRLRRNEELMETAKQIHAANLPAIEKNVKARLELGQIMDGLGIPRTYTAIDEKSRKSIKPRITLPSGWVEDLDRFLPVDDGFQAYMSRYNTCQNDLENKAAALQKAETEKREKEIRERAKEEEKRAAWVRVGILAKKYNLPEDTDEFALFDHILSQHPLLNLANAMMKTRGDWSNGFWRVEAALDGVPYSEYPDIVTDIYDCMDYDDGRVFRDTTYNYDVLFGMMDEELYRDYDEVYNILYNLHDSWYAD